MLNIQRNVPLAPFTTFGIGGPADYFVIIKTLEELKDAITWAKNPQVRSQPTPGVESPVSYFILGTGANILVGDKGYRGLIIKNEMRKIVISGRDTSLGRNDKNAIVTGESGALISDIIQQTTELGLSGLEHFAGIVSTVGGALWQNLHFLSADRSKTVYIADILESAVVLHEDGQEETVDKLYFQFGYDTSILHIKKDIVLSATFQLIPKDKADIQKTIDANILWRQEKHPKDAEHCSAGSIFKKIESFGAGRLIEKVGLKGKQIGGAQVSPVHANFIVNIKNATAKDVRDLITLIQQTVSRELHLDLEPEISFIGEF